MGDTEDAALPPGWARARLEDLITAIEAGLNVAAVGRAPDKGETGIVKISAVTWGEFDERQSKTLPRKMFIDPRLLISEGDFLISRANTLELVGAPVIVKKVQRRLVLSDKVLRLRFKHSLDHWVEFYLKSGAGRSQIESKAQGAQLSMRNISQENLRRIMVPIAPDPERRRILDILDCSLSEVGEVEAAMVRARERMADYRASLLHAACTGALTAAWRAANPHPEEDGPALLRRILAERHAAWERTELARLTAAGKVPAGNWRARYSTPEIGALREISELPETWTWATVQQLGFVSGGLTVNASNRTGATEHPYLRVANVAEGSLDLRDVRSIAVSPSEAVRVLLQPDDLLFVEGNGSADQIGRVALWDGSVPECVHQNHLIKFRGASPHMSRWLLLWFMSPLGKKIIQAAASSTSGLHTLSISKIARLLVPLPPLVEVEQVIEITSERQDLRADLPIVMNGSTLDLRRSILHAAFSGRIVPQDPADEPATALLARLRAEAIPATPRRRSARAGARL